MLELAKAKWVCRVDADYLDEDELFRDWIAQADKEIESDIDRKIIATEQDRINETDIVDCEKLDIAREIFVLYKYSRSLDGKPAAYWSTLKSLRNIGV